MADDFADRLRAATGGVEAVVADRSLLAASAAGGAHAAAERRRRRVLARRRRARAGRSRPSGASTRRSRAQARPRALSETGIRTLRAKPVFTTPNVFAAGDSCEPDDDRRRRRRSRVDRAAALLRVQAQVLTRIHPFYDQLCPECGDFNFAKRTETADLHGRVGAAHRRPGEDRLPGRHQAAARRRPPHRHHPLPARLGAALRAGARLRATGAHRLEIFGLDLRHTPSVEAFCHHLLDTHDRLDFIVNNACQTVRRPPDFYRHMMELEAASLAELPVAAAPVARRVRGSARLRHAPVRRRRRRSRAAPTSAGRHQPVRGSCRRLRCCPRTWPSTRPPVPRGPARPGPAAGRPARPQLVAAHAGRGVVGRAARDPARQRRRPVRAERPAQAADAAHARPRQAHRQRVGGRGPVLPAAQDRPGTRTPTWPRPR